MGCWSALRACLGYALGGCSSVSAEAGRVHPPKRISSQCDLVWDIMVIREDKADWKHVRGPFPNELKHALLIETTSHRASVGHGGGRRGKHWVRLWRGGGSLVKPRGLSGIQPWASKLQHRCLMWKKPTYLYFKTNFLGWGDFGEFTTYVKVRQSLGIECLVPGFHNIQYEEITQENDPLWLLIVKWQGESERVTFIENLPHAFLYFSLIITEVAMVQRGAIISIWRLKSPRRAIGIYWGVEMEGDYYLRYVLSCKQGTENWAQVQGQPMNKACSRSSRGVPLLFRRLFQVPSRVILEAPKDPPLRWGRRGHPYSLANNSAKPIRSTFGASKQNRNNTYWVFSMETAISCPYFVVLEVGLPDKIQGARSNLNFRQLKYFLLCSMSQMLHGMYLHTHKMIYCVSEIQI